MKTEINAHNSDLQPGETGRCIVGYVDIVNGSAAREVPDFEPTRHELKVPEDLRSTETRAPLRKGIPSDRASNLASREPGERVVEKCGFPARLARLAGARDSLTISLMTKKRDQQKMDNKAKVEKRLDPAAVELDEAIIKTMMELMDSGGTTPKQTFEVLIADFPDLCRQFGENEVIARCATIQQREVPEESQRLQELFDFYNARYFDGRLPLYAVHVVYDVNFWADEYFFNGLFLEEPSAGYHDAQHRRIFLRHGEASMEGNLLHEMAHAATNGHHDDPWLGEMRRLEAIGAPICAWELEPSDRIESLREGPQKILVPVKADRVMRNLP